MCRRDKVRKHVVAETVEWETLDPLFVGERLAPVSSKTNAYRACSFERAARKGPGPTIGALLLLVWIKEADRTPLICLLIPSLPEVTPIWNDERLIPTWPSLCQGAIFVHRYIVGLSKCKKIAKPNNVRGATK